MGSSRKRQKDRQKRARARRLERSGSDNVSTALPNQSRPMRTLFVPCPQCKQLVELMAYNDDNPQDVYIPGHSHARSDSTTVCNFEGPYSLPAFDSEFVYFPEDDLGSKCISPSERGYDPSAIPEDRPIMDRLTDYFRGCPFSTLLKIRSQMEEAQDSLFGLAVIFGEDGLNEYDNPFSARLKDIHEIIQHTLEHRLAEGLKNIHVGTLDDNVGFWDTVSTEWVEIPLSAIRIRQSRATKVNPDGSSKDAIRPFVPSPEANDQ